MVVSRSAMSSPESPVSNLTPLSRVRAFLELVRLPNVFTAMADVVMGFLFLRTVWEPHDAWLLGILLAASSLLYCSGIVLNDVADVEVDGRLRPRRPIPSGRVSLGWARRVGWSMLGAGLLLTVAAAAVAQQMRPALVGGALAACVIAYNGLLKRTPLGPPAMGACRALNVLLGMSAASAMWQPVDGLVAVALGVYISGVTWYARQEAEKSDRRQLVAATVVMLLGIGLLARLPDWSDQLVPLLQQQPGRWHLLMTLLGLIIAARCLGAAVEPLASRVQTAVKQCILSLVVLDAAVCFATSGLRGAIAILLLLVPTILLGRWIYST